MVIGNILFFLMMLAPQSWQFIKILLVVVSVALLILHYVIKIRKKINITLMIWFSILLTHGIIWSFIGAIKGNPGVSNLFRLHVIWTALYAAYVFYIDSIDKFKSLARTMVCAVIAISCFNIALILNVLNIIPDVNSFLKINDELTEVQSIYAGFIQLNSYNIGSLVFLAPFILALYVTDASYLVGISKKILSIACALSIITMLLSGRRALWLEMLVTPFLLFLFNIVSNRMKIRKNIIHFYSITVLLLIITGFLGTSYFNWDAIMFRDRFLSAFEYDVRQEQASALFKGFMEFPLIGSGFGIGVGDVVRSDASPWQYELTYVLMLYNTGILGSALYIICIGMIYLYFIKLLKNRPHYNSITLSVLTAFTCFIIANATNPYFESYDYMWMLYLPVAYINILAQPERTNTSTLVQNNA